MSALKKFMIASSLAASIAGTNAAFADNGPQSVGDDATAEEYMDYMMGGPDPLATQIHNDARDVCLSEKLEKYFQLDACANRLAEWFNYTNEALSMNYRIGLQKYDQKTIIEAGEKIEKVMVENCTAHAVAARAFRDKFRANDDRKAVMPDDMVQDFISLLKDRTTCFKNVSAHLYNPQTPKAFRIAGEAFFYASVGTEKIASGLTQNHMAQQAATPQLR